MLCVYAIAKQIYLPYNEQVYLYRCKSRDWRSKALELLKNSIILQFKPFSLMYSFCRSFCVMRLHVYMLENQHLYSSYACLIVSIGRDCLVFVHRESNGVLCVFLFYCCWVWWTIFQFSIRSILQFGYIATEPPCFVMFNTLYMFNVRGVHFIQDSTQIPYFSLQQTDAVELFPVDSHSHTHSSKMVNREKKTHSISNFYIILFDRHNAHCKYRHSFYFRRLEGSFVIVVAHWAAAAAVQFDILMSLTFQLATNNIHWEFTSIAYSFISEFMFIIRWIKKREQNGWRGRETECTNDTQPTSICDNVLNIHYSCLTWAVPKLLYVDHSVY